MGRIGGTPSPTNIEHNTEPNIEPNMESNIQPNIESNIELNIEDNLWWMMTLLQVCMYACCLVRFVAFLDTFGKMLASDRL